MAMNDPTGGPDPAAGAPAPHSDSFPREYVEKIRREAAGWRTKYQALEGQAQGQVKQQNEVKPLKLALGLTNVAHAQGVDVDLAEFLLRKAGQFDDLDPDADNFTQTLSERVDNLMAQHPTQLRPS